MIDLNTIKGGMKLIQKVMKNNKSNKAPWSKQQQREQLSKQVNVHNTKTRKK